LEVENLHKPFKAIYIPGMDETLHSAMKDLPVGLGITIMGYFGT